jgi:hypothetical protein
VADYNGVEPKLAVRKLKSNPSSKSRSGEVRKLRDGAEWLRLRGCLKDVFAKMGGGEAYLKAERDQFYSPSPK